MHCAGGVSNTSCHECSRSEGVSQTQYHVGSASKDVPEALCHVREDSENVSETSCHVLPDVEDASNVVQRMSEFRRRVNEIVPRAVGLTRTNDIY